ncbi:hypothetical protein SSP531S_30220 [Streptomyces spongiicola]|uniref:Uncharacterized protein n=1 Tax=Streptomyces spongiicola TaxID=1690221 RepID=A0A388T0C7_9ACTN|nr:hypothetical protein SSP531S_30220 [Streptomyces spongiicola]
MAAPAPAGRRCFGPGCGAARPAASASGERFRSDAAAGALPEVPYPAPGAIDCESPGSSSPIASATIPPPL